MLHRYEPDRASDRPRATTWQVYEKWLNDSWKQLLNSDPTELLVQKFLEMHPSLIPGASDGIGPGGHHGAWWDAVVTQPPLQGIGPKRIPDFMWIRRDTESTRPILIEIESPKKNWYNTSNLHQTADLTQALDQLDEWRDWFDREENRQIFKSTYVPPRFAHRTLKPQYVLVYGRSSEFRPHGRHSEYARARRKRDMLEDRPNTRVFTFDMLRPRIEAQDYVTIGRSLSRFKIVAVPPTFQTQAFLLEEGSLLDAVSGIVEGLTDTPLISKERRTYIVDRWNHWTNIKRSREWNEDRGTLSSGFE